MRRIITTIVAVFLLSAATLRAQEYLKKPKGGLPIKDNPELAELIIEIDFFPNGFYWVDREGHSWWVLPNPLLRISDTNLLQVNAYLYYDLRELAKEKGWEIYTSLKEYLATPLPSGSHPPVFQQSEKR